ncbi:MAG TPA: hypothetical protein VHB79_04640 [Polyangiaceae bacterium]|nr:hypothetical protein [Polyangiaceae bacterium]
MPRLTQVALGLALPLIALGDAGCSLLLHSDAKQCSVDADCVALGLENTTCSGQVCVLRGANGGGGGSAGSVTNGGDVTNGGRTTNGGDATNGGNGEPAGTGATAGSSGGNMAAAGNAGVAGSGGSNALAGSGGSGGAAPQLDSIDDLEDGNRTIRLVANPKRDGLWDTGNDGSGSQTPAPGGFMPTLLNGNGPHGTDDYAAYTKGSGFTGYGAFLKVDMRNWPVYEQTPPYDASPYSGISFWAKVGAGSTKLVRIRFVSGDSDPRGGKCQPPSANPPHDQLCFNHYFAELTLSTAWKLYTVAFADFSQGVDGKLSPQIDLAEMYGLELLFAGGAGFELWLDDLSFIRK